MRRETVHEEVGEAMKKFVAFALALSFAALLAATTTEASKGRGGHDDPRECQVRRGVLVCK